jgi:glucose dehydrogenase
VRGPRLLFRTEDGELCALDAKTGRLVPEFGALNNSARSWIT